MRRASHARTLRPAPRRAAERVLRVTAATLGLVVGALALALGVGVEPVHLTRALSDPASVDHAILFGARLPRVLFGALVGAALAPAGVAFQALLRNPLGDPYVLGVSGGASVGGTVAIVLGLGLGLGIASPFTLPLAAFLGALGAIALIFTFGRVRGRLVPHVALLCGVVLNAFTAAVIVALRLIASPLAAHEALVWLTGTLGSIEPLSLALLGVYVAVGLGVLYQLAPAMNALALGDEAAHIVGVETERARRSLFLGASLLTGAAVALAGPIGFVGILVPHAVRRLVGPDHRLVLPASAGAGAAFLVLADMLTRLSFLWLGTEPTVGVLTALLGGPFFLWVLRRRGLESLG